MTSFSPEHLFKRYEPYFQLSRFDKPTGAWLVLFPAFWGLTLAYKAFPPVMDLVIFTLAAFLVRGAGCTANDLMDRNLDPHVARTKKRPLARGALTTGQGISYLLGQLFAASIFLFFMPVEVFYLALGAVALMMTYPLLKRITYWPQLFLGLCMNYSLLMAYVYVRQELSIEVLVLYIGSVFWTLAYDTIYGHQDKKDDVLVGIKSTALSTIGSTKIFLSVCYALFLSSLGWVFIEKSPDLLSLSLLMIPAALLFYQIFFVRFDQPQSCLKAFKLNSWVGFLVWVVLVYFFMFSTMGAS